MADSKDAILENMYDNEKAFSSAIFQQAVNVNRAIFLTGGGEGMVRNIFLGDGFRKFEKIRSVSKNSDFAISANSELAKSLQNLQ